jgi:hypothetical protein
LCTRPAAASPEPSTNWPSRALVAAFADSKGMVDERAARTAIAEVTTE